jgi:prevent-host-death family protein
MERKMSATDARIHFGELMRHVVEKQEPVIVEHSGKPHVVVISVDKYERLLAAQEKQEDWRELVDQAREQVRVDLGGRDLTPPEEVLREVRGRRDEQLTAVR